MLHDGSKCPSFGTSSLEQDQLVNEPEGLQETRKEPNGPIKKEQEPKSQQEKIDEPVSRRSFRSLDSSSPELSALGLSELRPCSHDDFVANLAKEKPKIIEIFLAPRVTPVAARQGLKTTEPANLDLKSGWNALDYGDRQKMWRILEEQAPDVVILSPECKMFSQLMNINLRRIPIEKLTKEQMEALVMWQLCLQVADFQLQKGRFFIIEQPAGASSWRTHGFEWLLKQKGVLHFLFDQCELGLSVDKKGEIDVEEQENQTEGPFDSLREELLGVMSQEGLAFSEFKVEGECLMVKPFKGKSQEFNMKEATPEEVQGFKNADQAEWKTILDLKAVKAIDYLNFVKPWDEKYKHDTQTNVKQFLRWKQLYEASGCQVPECWPKQVKHDGHTISVSDIWFIAHHMKKLTTKTGTINRIEKEGVVLSSGDFMACDVVVGCIGFERSNTLCEWLTGRKEVKTTNYLDQHMMYLADAEIDEGAFNSFFGSSVLEYGKFFTNVFVEGLKRPDVLAQQLWGEHTTSGCGSCCYSLVLMASDDHRKRTSHVFYLQFAHWRGLVQALLACAVAGFLFITLVYRAPHAKAPTTAPTTPAKSAIAAPPPRPRPTERTTPVPEPEPPVTLEEDAARVKRADRLAPLRLELSLCGNFAEQRLQLTSALLAGLLLGAQVVLPSQMASGRVTFGELFDTEILLHLVPVAYTRYWCVRRNWTAHSGYALQAEKKSKLLGYQNTEEVSFGMLELTNEECSEPCVDVGNVLLSEGVSPFMPIYVTGAALLSSASARRLVLDKVVTKQMLELRVASRAEELVEAIDFILAKHASMFSGPSGSISSSLATLTRLQLGRPAFHYDAWRGRSDDHRKSKSERKWKFTFPEFDDLKGACMRLDVPVVGILDPLVLYTDVDILFHERLEWPKILGLTEHGDRDQEALHALAHSTEYGTFTHPSGGIPEFFSMATELIQSYNVEKTDTGVMLMNLRNLQKTYVNFTQFLFNRKKAWDYVPSDPCNYKAFYRSNKGKLLSGSLPFAMSWKPWWEVSSDVLITHFHGPKCDSDILPYVYEGMVRFEPFRSFLEKCSKEKQCQKLCCQGPHFA
eukprot:g3019.t1